MGDQAALAGVIKRVHAELRAKCQKDGSSDEAVWRQHVTQDAVLSEYAESMRRLATEVWDDRHAGAPELSRIAWTHQAILQYYTEPQLARARAYDDRLAQRHGATHCWSSAAELSRLAQYDTLDAGSCYDPFRGLARLRVTAVDLCPAAPSVLRGDLLTAPLAARTAADAGRLLSLAAAAWHAVCFCLLLEYLPTPALRLACCRRAAALLRPEGVLVVVSPDSAHRTANGRLYRGWRLALAALGLVRVRYEKTEHLHCMVFRKSVHPELVAAEAREQIRQDAARGRLVWSRAAPEPRRPPAGGGDGEGEAGSSPEPLRPPAGVGDGEGEAAASSAGRADRGDGDAAETPEPHQLMVIHQDLKPTVLTSAAPPAPPGADFGDLREAISELPQL